MAEGIAKKVIMEDALSDIQVESAGVNAVEGFPVSDDILDVMRARGVDLADHRSKRFTPNLGPDDIVLVMTKRHKQKLLEEYPLLAGRAFLLNEYAKGIDEDIPDPFLNELSYEQTAIVLEDSVREALQKVTNRQL